MDKNTLINIFKENIYNGYGTALYSNCGWGYVYEAISKNEIIRIGINKILGMKNNSEFPFFSDKYDLTLAEFNDLSLNLPKRYKKLKILTNNICTVRNKGSVKI